MPHYLNLFVALLCIVKLEILTCFVMKHFSKISSKVDAKFSFPVSKDIMACSTSSEPESNNANFRSGLEKVISTVGSVTTLSVLAFVAPATAEEVVKKVKKPKVLEVRIYCGNFFLTCSIFQLSDK